MDAPSAHRRQRNARTALVVVLFILPLVLLPGFCNRMERPSTRYAAYGPEVAEKEIGAGWLTRRVPPSATDLRVKHDPRSGRSWARFRFEPRDREGMTNGLRELSREEAQKLEVANPGWTRWWTLSPRVLESNATAGIVFYEIPAGEGGGHMGIAVRENVAFFWK